MVPLFVAEIIAKICGIGLDRRTFEVILVKNCSDIHDCFAIRRTTSLGIYLSFGNKCLSYILNLSRMAQGLRAN